MRMNTMSIKTDPTQFQARMSILPAGIFIFWAFSISASVNFLPNNQLFTVLSGILYISVLYTLLFNTRNQQTIYDHFLNTFVIHKNDLDEIELLALEKRHYFFVLILPLLGWGITLLSLFL